MRNFLYLILLFTGIATAASCSDTCDENKNALPIAGFYYSGSASTDAITMDSLEITVIGAPGDSALSAASVSKNEIYLPFRIDSDTTSYVFIDRHYQGGLRDTVTFIYTRTPRVASLECGVSYIFDIQSIVAQGVLIDSVICPNGFIDNSGIQNLKIYFDI